MSIRVHSAHCSRLKAQNAACKRRFVVRVFGRAGAAYGAGLKCCELGSNLAEDFFTHSGVFLKELAGSIVATTKFGVAVII